VQTELLAQLVEVTSVGVAQRALKNPIEIPRPGYVRPDGQAATFGGSDPQQDTRPAAAPDAFARGISLLASTSLGGAA
jgi:hypothetical protein